MGPLPQLTRPPPRQGAYVHSMLSQLLNPGPYALPPTSQVNSGPYVPPARVAMALSYSGSYVLPPSTHSQSPAPVGMSGSPRASGPPAASAALTRAQPPLPKYRMYPLLHNIIVVSGVNGS